VNRAQGVGSPSVASVSASDEDQTQLDPVVVTAQWRTEDLQSVPAALTAVTSTELLNAGVTDTVSLSLAVPGLSYTQQANGATPFIRVTSGRRPHRRCDRVSSLVFKFNANDGAD